jgi:predicted ferric reductase
VALRLLTARRVGPAVIVGLVAAYAAVWFAAGPAGQPAAAYLGQFFGAEAVLLLSVGLVLISTLPWVEVLFDGIDKAAIWHRRVAITGLFLLLLHVALAANPDPTSLGPPLAVIGAVGLIALGSWAVVPRWRSLIPRRLHGLVLAVTGLPGLRRIRIPLAGYERWRSVHRFTGLFVAAGFAHALLDGTPFPHSPLLRWTFVGVGGTGLAFYAYRELLARRFVPMHDYQVDAVRAVGTGITEISLRPLGQPVSFAPGQFAMLFLEGTDGWHRHPFTIASAPGETSLRFAIKALGDDTERYQHALRRGMPAVIGGPFGRFSHAKGTPRQFWVAGGIGVTPFLSWLRALDQQPPRGPVDFFYSSADPDMPYADEIRELAGRSDLVRAHLVDSRQGLLTAERVLAEAGGTAASAAAPGLVSVFLCGPAGMVSALQSGFRHLGVPSQRIYREYFDWRLP